MDCVQFLNELLDLNNNDDEEIIVNFCNFMLQNFFEESESARVNVGVNIHLWKEIEDLPFYESFRMNRPTFRKLVIAVGEYLDRINRPVQQDARIPLDLSIIMSLWVLATGDTFRSTAAHFGVTKGVVFYHYVRFISVMTELKGLYIKWPSEIERDNIAARFEERNGFPGCVGAIDGPHIYVTAPLIQARAYTNRHHTYSIIAQAVCDDSKLFRDVYVGEPGSVGDARVFQRSPLNNNLYNPDMIRGEEHLVGDKAYTLSDKIIIPYPSDTDDAAQRHFNFTFSGCRVVIQMAFELLKEKFQRLRRFRSYSLPVAIKHIMTAFVLHNFIILEGNVINEAGADENVAAAVPNENVVELSKQRGATKREYMCQMLWNENL